MKTGGHNMDPEVKLLKSIAVALVSSVLSQMVIPQVIIGQIGKMADDNVERVAQPSESCVAAILHPQTQTYHNGWVFSMGNEGDSCSQAKKTSVRRIAHRTPWDSSHELLS